MEETNKNIRFPYYSGNIKLTKVIGHVSLDEFIKAHKYPKQATIDIMLKVQEATKAGDLTLKRELKHKLYSFTPSAFFKLGVGRKYDSVEEFTGLMQLDFDCIETVDKARELKSYIFETYKQVICAYLSPSGKGVKALMRITKPTSREHYRAIYKTVENEFEQFGYFDVATKNAILPLFLSIDTDILYRDFSECDVWNKEDWSDIIRNSKSTPQLNFIPSERYSNEAQYTYDKTVRILESKMNNIVDCGHPAVRTNSLVLGSRVAAGYISKQEAETLIINLIQSNDYLSKNVEGYIKTALWGISEGSNSAKYY